jgi:two-component system chemotaxis sensor kinase CheA
MDPKRQAGTDIEQLFVAEAEEQLSILEEGLLRLETEPADGDMLGRIFRAAHTLKGGASLLEVEGIARLAHAVEEVLDSLRSGGVTVESGLVSLLLSAVDGLRSLTEELRATGEVDASGLESLRLALMSWPDSEDQRRAFKAPEEPASELETPTTRRAPTSLRVDVDKLDALLEAVGEVALARRTFEARLAADGGRDSRELREHFADGAQSVEELRRAVMDLRMVPLGPRLKRFERAVRDAATRTGKAATLEVDDGGVEVDVGIAQQLGEPLTHLVRNAVDHGIEDPATRERSGKPPRGSVTLRARRQGAGVVIEVADDGAGLARAALEERAREWDVADPSALSDEELWELVFLPGFSTAETVSDLSGRGVGMDAVRCTVEAMRGTIGLSSEAGVGTTVTITVPSALTTLAGLEIGVGDRTYVLPLDNVVECADRPADCTLDGPGMISMAGRALPLVSLGDAFGVPHGEPGKIVIVRHGRLEVALGVDSVHAGVDSVVRSLGAGLDGDRGLAGSIVMEDGRVGLVIDVPGLLRSLEGPTAVEPTSTKPLQEQHA